MSTLSNRPYHAFFSYSHKDRDIALKIYSWLTRIAGFQIWFDENHLEAGSPVAVRLTEQMSACRTWIVLVTKDSILSNWVIAERDQAIHNATENRDFKLIAMRVDNCPLNQEWLSLARFSWLDIPGDGFLTLQNAREIIDRLDGRTWSGRQNEFRDVYVSRGWRPADRPFADAVCKGFCTRKWKLQLIGDAPDQTSFSVDRIRDIMAACSGHLVILPRRISGNFPTEQDYKYIIREKEISADLGIPCLMLVEKETLLPPSLESIAIKLSSEEDLDNSWMFEPPAWLENFMEELKQPPDPQHLFLAAEFKENTERVSSLRDFIESVTGLSCQIGLDFQGQGLRDQIVSSIATSLLVVANLATFEEPTDSNSGINLNTCVEAGIALGASNSRVLYNKKPMPVFLTVHCKHEEKNKTARLPFMFRDSQITWFANEAELLGHCRRILLPYRRRIMNFEFAKPN